MPHSKNVAKTLTNLTHFGRRGKRVRKKKKRITVPGY